ncbi:MAG TPA: response regulator [Desulfuromonadales bacterium]|nr:response regulator [Desulfuromonadales bacterium]
MSYRLPRILCVDDEPMNLGLLEAMLAPRGFEVITASNGYEAIEKIGERIDLCLLDVMMPGIDGFEVCRRLKGNGEHSNIPVIMITACFDKENRIRGIEAGAEDFISKPFDSSEVMARITMLLRVKGLNDQLHSAYASINNLTCLSKQILSGFDPFHFSFIDSIRDIVRQIIAVSPDRIEQPRRVLLSLRGINGEFGCYAFGHDSGAITMTILPATICRHLEKLADGRELVWLNQEDLQNGHRELVAELTENMEPPVNLICNLSSQITFCAINYGRPVNHFDAEVLNAIVAESLFLKSLSEQVRETESAFAYTVMALARAAEVNDDDTGEHILRVGDYCALLAAELGMPEEFIELIRLQAILHDVGKIHLSVDILHKPAALTAGEFELVKQHPADGAKIIGDHIRLTLAKSIAISHHERFDGSGYPHGLVGEQIPIEGRIMNLADQYDALRSKRCYKAALSHEEAFCIISDGNGRTIPQHFDPRVLAAFRSIHGRFAEVFEAKG